MAVNSIGWANKQESQVYAQNLLANVKNGNQDAIDSICSGIFDSTAGRLGTNEAFVEEVINNADAEILTMIMDRYSEVTGSEIYKDIENDYSGKSEKELIEKLENAYTSTKDEEYTGWDDGKLNNKQIATSVGKGILDKLPSIGLIAAGTVAAPAIASATGAILTGVLGAAAAATVATIAAPILAVAGIAAAGYMIYKGVTETKEAIDKGKNSQEDNTTMDAVRQGTNGVIEAGEGVYIGAQSVKGLVESVKNIKTQIDTKKVATTQTQEAQNPKSSYQLEESSLERGTSYLAEEGTPEHDALYDLVKEEFVSVKNKDMALEIFREQYSSLGIQEGEEVFILNPSNPAKVAKNIGTSNAYMSDWYAEANGLSGRVFDVNTIQDAISGCSSDAITIVVPDDCAITGNSLISNTTRVLNGLNIPEGVNIRLVYSPMINSTAAQNAFEAVSAMDMEALTEANILSVNNGDYTAVEEFFAKYAGRIEVSLPDGIIQARPYYESGIFIDLQNQNPELAETIEAILTNNGSANGFGRPGQSGVMIATPTSDGITLKCPNNNVYGASPYALIEGATPETIKRPGNMSVKKWHTRLEKMLQELLQQVA